MSDALHEFYQWLPPEGIKILVVLFLSFLVGLEREEHRASGGYSFGGVRTFPLIGLIGYAVAFLSGGELLPMTIGFAVVGGFLMLSFHHKLTSDQTPGVTSEMSGLVTYLVGTLVYKEQFWIATAVCVASTLLLELKVYLEKLTTRIAPGEILTFTKFLLLTVVILPVLPNQEFGPFAINPFKTWLVVVAVSTVSYGSYVIQRLTTERGVVLSAILGGAYSSTVTTVVIARRAKREKHPHLFSGGTLIACGVMYARLTVLLALFNHALMIALAPWVPVLLRHCGSVRMVLVAAERSGLRRGQAGVRSPQSAGATGGTPVCRPVPGDADRDAPGRAIPGPAGRIHSGRRHGRGRRRSLHHGNDTVSRISFLAGGSGGRHRDCRVD